MKATVRAQLEEALGMMWTDYKSRHPHLASAVEIELGDPITVVVNKLDEGPEYQELLTQTEAESQIANVVKALAPIAEKILGIALL